MRRNLRAELAREAVAIAERGAYRSASGRDVDIAEAVRACCETTHYYAPQDLDRLRRGVLSRPDPEHSTAFEVVNETTLAGVARMLAQGHGPVAALNFASAKRPGGGFLSGAQAQEESLARSSALYASLLRVPEFYQQYKASPASVYSDAAIVSPACPIFRDDEGDLLDEPQLVTFLTSAAPNAGAVAANHPEALASLPGVLRRRSECILAVAAAHGFKCLILGAWGCGVFRNDPNLVAEIFAEHLKRGAWQGRFKRVVFSVLDLSPAQETFAAFQRAFG